jgi:hypothetical protein
MAQQHPTSTPIWHLALVSQAAALAGCQKIGTGTWQDGQQVAFWRRTADQWVVFDGAETYFILTTEEAKHALTSCRDAEQKVCLADDQGRLNLRSLHTLQESMGCRPTRQRAAERMCMIRQIATWR